MSFTITQAVQPNAPEPKSISRELIFLELARRTCKVIWTTSQETVETSGCFIKDYSSQAIQVLSCFHDNSWASASTVQIVYRERRVHAKLNQGVSIPQAMMHDLCLLDLEQEGTQYDCFDFKGTFAQPRLGQKIYFAGFPFGTDQALVHKGYISLTERAGESHRFTINGTIVPGHSGGPIVLVEANEIQLLGIISSQLCDISKRFTELSNTQLPSFVASNDSAPSYGNSDVRSVLKETMDYILANFSTGIGKATYLTNITSLMLEKAVVSEQKKETASTTYRMKKSTSFSSSMDLEDRSASVALGAMEAADPWMKRKGIGVNNSLESDLSDSDVASNSANSNELKVGRKNRTEKKKKKIEKEGRQVRAEMKETGNFQNNGIPPLLYRFVSKKDAKVIRKDGIVHLGGIFDEIPFITKSKKGMAQSVGAVSVGKLVTVYTDRIPGLLQQNITTLHQQNGVLSYKLNMTVPKEAIEISEV